MCNVSKFNMCSTVLFSMRLTLKRTRYFSTVFYSSQPERANAKNIRKVVNVAIIGAPNSGKSTLINQIVERKVCASSNKVHTTTKLARALCVYHDTQIVFLDTPGVVNEKEQKKYKLPDSMINAYHKSLRCADVIGVVHDISNYWTKDSLHCDVKNMLKSVDTIPSFLIINKVDKLKSKKQLLSIIRNLTNGYIAGYPVPGSKKKEKENLDRGYSKFSDVFIISALNGDGVKDLKEYLVNNAKESGLQYPTENWSDQTPEALIEETVRSKFLDFLAQEIPYNLTIQLEYFEDKDDEDKIICSVCVECPSERILRLIKGAGGGRLNQIKSYARDDLMEMFKKTVVLDLQMKVRNKSS